MWCKSTEKKKKILKRVCVLVCRANLFVGGTVNKRLHSILGKKFPQFSSFVPFTYSEQGSLVSVVAHFK
jgi:hypothetical protein